MDPKQAGLAASFGDFISRMVQTNTNRVNHGLEPVDFHIAVTTSSVFLANASHTSCQAGSGGNSCCSTVQCADVASCTPGTSNGCGAGQLCVTTEVQGPSSTTLSEKAQCCDVTSCAPTASGCHPGDVCAAMVTSYPSTFPGNCTPGLATAGAPYGKGTFVSAPGNPKVLDFDKTLAWGTWGTATPDPQLTQLVQQFRQNIQVGSCGSGEEQHLEAGRLAMQLARAGQQPGVAVGTWPHAGSKLVIVWVGDEDDCSSPSQAPVILTSASPGADSCVWDKHQSAGSQRELPVSDFASYFSSLVGSGGAADFGAAFIVSGVGCQGGGFAPADSCSGTPACPVNPPATCTPIEPVCSGDLAAGERFQALADSFKARGFEVVEGSVCDAYPPRTFGPILSAIADLATPPSSLKLETQPAAADVTVLRIVGADGSTRRVCTPGTDWCFVSCSDTSASPACLAAGATSQCIAIDHRNGVCEANPGETYSAEYLGMVPPGGCATAADCTATLGNGANWVCYASPGQSRGTCVCGQ